MYMQRPPEDRIDRYTGPYERWIYAAELGFPFAFPAIREGGQTHFSALKEGKGDLAAGPDVEIRVPPLWSADPEVTPFAIFDQQRINPRAAPAGQDTKLSRILNQIGGPRFRLNMPINPATWPAAYHPDDALTGWIAPEVPPRAIIGVIDDGIPFVHRAFVGTSGQTRMALCWLQAARAGDAAAVPFGREVINAEIDSLRTTHGRNEMAMYRASGAIDADLPELGTVLTHHATHGAHIAGIAAGNDPYVGAEDLPDDVQIIAVQLPNTIAWDTSGIGKEMMMLAAIEYVFHRARAIAAHYGVPEIPLILNFSYGWSANRHDGNSSFEVAVEDLLQARKAVQPLTELVMPTGNNFDKRMHASFTGGDMAEGLCRFGWNLLPDDRTSSYLEIWLPPGFDPDGWQVTVAPPAGSTLDGPAVIDIAPDPDQAGGDPRRFVELEAGGANIGQLSVDKHRNSRWRVMIAVVPTVPTAAERRRAPAGLWTISVATNGTALPAGQAVNIWVQRDDDPTQLGTGGQQSYLVDLDQPAPTPRAFYDLDTPIGPVRGYGCINAISTSPSTLRVAGYDQMSGAPAAYSGGSAIGVLADGTVTLGPEKPFMTAVSDQGAFRPGLPSIGVLSGSGARIVGTSAAAASASRLLVGNIAHGRDLLEGIAALPEIPLPPSLRDARKRVRTGSYVAPPVCGSQRPKPGFPPAA